MLGSLYRFLRRNSTKIVISGFAISGALLIYRCVKNGLLEEEFYKLQLLNKYRTNFMFENYQNLSKNAVNQMLLPLKNIIDSMINLEKKLQLLTSLDTKEKLNLWEEIKILSFSRLFLSMYSYCILLTIIEINFSSITCKSLQNDSISDPRQINNFNFDIINNFFVEGIKTLYNNIQSSTKNIVSPISLKEKFNKDDLIGLMYKLKNEIEINGLQYQFDISMNQKSNLECYIDHFNDENNEFQKFMDAHLKAMFEKLNSILEEEFKSKEKRDTQIFFPMAKIIPLISNLTDNFVFKRL